MNDPNPHSVPLQVVYGVNSNFLLPALISAYSVWKNASRPVDITIFGDRLGEQDHEFVRQVSTSCDRTILYQKFDSSGLEAVSQVDNFRYPTISLLPLVLPGLIKGRCLFLDADTLVLGDVLELLSADLRGMPIGACLDVGMAGLLEGSVVRMGASDVLRPAFARRKREAQIRRFVSLGFIPGEDVFNSGVMVMDCDEIRRINALDELSNPDGLRPFLGHLPDQDRLNEVFAGRWHQFPLKWNASPTMRTGSSVIRRSCWSDGFREQMHEATNDPQIRHYMGRKKKPWIRSWRTTLTRRQAYRDYTAVCREFEVRTGLKI